MGVGQEHEEVPIKLDSVAIVVDEFAFEGKEFVGERGVIAREAAFPSEGTRVNSGLSSAQDRDGDKMAMST